MQYEKKVIRCSLGNENIAAFENVDRLLHRTDVMPKRLRKSPFCGPQRRATAQSAWSARRLERLKNATTAFFNSLIVASTSAKWTMIEKRAQSSIEALAVSYTTCGGGGRLAACMLHERIQFASINHPHKTMLLLCRLSAVEERYTRRRRAIIFIKPCDAKTATQVAVLRFRIEPSTLARGARRCLARLKIATSAFLNG